MSDAPGQWKDNARLRESVTELLEALKLLLGHSGLDVDAQDKDPEDHAAERVARAAIAKAETQS